LAIHGTCALPRTSLPRYEVLHEKPEVLDEKLEVEKIVTLPKRGLLPLFCHKKRANPVPRYPLETFGTVFF
jgi:hypothetical protein